MSQLAEVDRKRLDGIVQQMLAKGEPDENIRFVVSDFKKKYAKPKGGFLDDAFTRIKAQKLPPNYKPPVVKSKLSTYQPPTVPTQDPAKAVNGMAFANTVNQITGGLAKKLAPLDVLPGVSNQLRSMGVAAPKTSELAAGAITGPLDLGADALVFADAKSTREQQVKALTNFALKSGIVPAGWVAGKLAKPVFNKAVQLLKRGQTEDAAKVIQQSVPQFDIPEPKQPPQAPPTKTSTAPKAVETPKVGKEPVLVEVPQSEAPAKFFESNPPIGDVLVDFADPRHVEIGEEAMRWGSRVIFKNLPDDARKVLNEGQYPYEQWRKLRYQAKKDDYGVLDSGDVPSRHADGGGRVSGKPLGGGAPSKETAANVGGLRNDLTVSAGGERGVIAKDIASRKDPRDYYYDHDRHLNVRTRKRDNYGGSDKIIVEVAIAGRIPDPHKLPSYITSLQFVDEADAVAFATERQWIKPWRGENGDWYTAQNRNTAAALKSDDGLYNQPSTTPPIAPKGGETPPVAPKTDVPTPEAPGGLSRASRAVHADVYGTNKPTTIGGKSLDELYEQGKRKLDEGFDADEELAELAKGGRPATDEQIGIFAARRDALLADLKRLNSKLDKGDRTVIEQRDELFEQIAEFDRHLDEVKGAGGRSLGALRIGQTVNWSDLDEVLLEAKRVSPSQLKSGTVKQFRELTEKQVKTDERVAVLEKELAEVKAGGVVEKAKRGPRFDKASLDKELEDLFAEGKKKLGQASAGLDPELFGIAGKIALNYAKRGVNTLDEIVENVQEVWKAQFGQEIDRQDVIDALGTPKAKGELTADQMTRKELQAQITSLRAQAKRESTAGKATKAEREQMRYAERVFDTEEKIADLQNQLETGNFRIPNKRELVISKELQGLKDEKALYQAQVQSAIRGLTESALKKGAKEVAGAVRGTILGSDFGVLTRQGLFGLSRPVEFAKAVGKGAKAAFSEKNLAGIEKRIFDHDVGGMKAGVAYKKHGLSLSSHLTNPEELVIGKLIRRIPGLGRLAGTLERGQTAFINTLRSETFDRALRLGYKDNELAARANFINSATGRSNAKQIPTLLQLVMTSPRYERSRWEMLAQPLRNAGVIVKDLATKKGLNRGAVANIQDMAVTAAEVYGLYKLAELNGYEVNFDPTSSDFLKMRKGDEVWDPSAGIAPRMRDVMRFVAWGVEPTYQQNVSKVVSQTVLRTVSPAMKQPVEAGAQQVQRMRGVPEDKLASFFSGWKIDHDEKGLITFAPLIVQTAKKYLDEGDYEGAASAAFREFVGQSVNRYPAKAK